MYDVTLIDRKLAQAAQEERLDELELLVRSAVVDLAVVCNVLELSPLGRVVRESELHERIRARVDEIAWALDRIDDAVAA